MDLPDWLNQPALPTEETFDRFIKNFGGQKIADFLPGNPTFKNADYIFRSENVIAELKTLQTDFGTTDSFRDNHLKLLMDYISDGRMTFGAIFRSAERPKEYVKDLLFQFLETETGKFDNRVLTDDSDIIFEAKAIPRSRD